MAGEDYCNVHRRSCIYNVGRSERSKDTDIGVLWAAVNYRLASLCENSAATFSALCSSVDEPDRSSVNICKEYSLYK